MPIESSAVGADELSSPYYEANKKLCEDWENYILDKGGQINGKYGAWSFSLKSKVKTIHTWLIDVKKATYSNGNLLLSSKKQNLQELVIFKVKVSCANASNFIIRERKKTDFLFGRTILSKNQPKYSLIGAESNDKLIAKLRPILDIWATNESLQEIEFTDGLLSLSFAHMNETFELAEMILSLNLEDDSNKEH